MDEKTNNNDITIDELIKKIDNIPLIPDEELGKMDFYELAYYVQTLNNIETIGSDNESVGE